MKKISIIVPCYNAISYIDRCLESIVNQTIGVENLEIILVNDASTDNTLEILYQWQKRYPESIMIIDCKKNGRQGTARNIAIKFASADYIGYVDNDDIIELTMFEKLYNIITTQDVEVAMCRYIMHTIEAYDRIRMGRVPNAEDKLYVIDDSNRLDFLNLKLNIAPWNKLYRKDFILNHNIHFIEKCNFEDILFTELVYLYVKRFYLLEEYLYHHIIRDESSSRDTNDWKGQVDWFFAQMIKIRRVRELGFYQLYQKHYERDHINIYLAFVEYIFRLYGPIHPKFINALNKTFLEETPGYRSISHVHYMINHGHRFYKVLLEKMEKEYTDEDCEEIYDLFLEKNPKK